MESIRAFYRLVVMAGTVAVLGMAFIAYGPPLDEVGPMLGRASGFVREAIAEWQANSRQTVAEPPQLALTPLTTSNATTAIPELSPTSETELIRKTVTPRVDRTSPEPTTEMETLISELNSLGMGAYKLARWGSTGELYRFTCRMAYPAQAAMEQHFEAVADQPITAVAIVLNQVRAVRKLN